MWILEMRISLIRIKKGEGRREMENWNNGMLENGMLENGMLENGMLGNGMVLPANKLSLYVKQGI
jgi:hypothetical protein